MRIILLLLILIITPSLATASSINSCEPKFDAFINNYEIYRLQAYNSVISNCIPTNESYIQIKGHPESRVPFEGFVVGIESFWHPALRYLVKVTSKAGGNVTLVMLLKHQKAANQFDRGFREVFSSSIGYISVLNEGLNSLFVVTRDEYISESCRGVDEIKYQYSDGKFIKTNKAIISRECK
ncbi:hypothetical protein MED121_17584 [Marinomonas sp. MED121]|uniref:hypothetical protein n=1 Tax=Marinomonas sp. MED121 TaxID=314277 RepID=UPI0000691064|nr:hypothetical protein [Marinomonas sp. MED121]EAQ67762.1 hypothetical protein MED121_17584 [Marinomonas sp. MED121]